MSQKPMTKDEQFLLKLFEMASSLGDAKAQVDRYAVGRAIGQNDRGSYVISRDLAQANFIKKGEGEAVYLTDHGLRLIATLRGA